MEREGRAPLSGLGKLRPLEVCRQTPDLFPGIRHHRPTRLAADEQQTRQPNGGSSKGGTGRAKGQQTPAPTQIPNARVPRQWGRAEEPRLLPSRAERASTAVRAGSSWLGPRP